MTENPDNVFFIKYVATAEAEVTKAADIQPDNKE
jgi:hypothetical protein